MVSLSDLVITRLKGQVPELKDVLSGADLAALQTSPPGRFPCAYVLGLAEQGAANRYMTGVVAQRRSLTLGVILVVRNVRDATGQAAKSDMEALRAKVDLALFGYLAAPEYEPLVFAKGALMQVGDGVLWWQDEYQTARDVRN